MFQVMVYCFVYCFKKMKNRLLLQCKPRWLLLFIFLSPLLSVADQRAAAPQPALKEHDKTVFLETEARPARPYVQAQITYSVRLFYRGKLLQISASLPQLTGASMQAIGNDSKTEIIRENHRFLVWERKYAVFAEHSGPLNIPPLQVTARLAARRASASGILKSRSIALRTAIVTITVRPRPPGFKSAYWLPAERVSLYSTPVSSPLLLGRPLDYTIVLEAAGLRGFQLPAIELNRLPWAGSYAAGTQLSSQQSGDRIIGRSENHFTLIPQRPGRVSLPEIRLNWWNTRTGRQETATLTEKILVVSGRTPSPQQTPAGVNGVKFWFWLGSVLLALLLLLFIAWRR